MERNDVARPVLTREFLRLGDLGLGHEARDAHLHLFGVRIALRCGNAEPSVRVHWVSGNVAVSEVDESEAELTADVTLHGGAAEPPHCLGVIFRNALAIVVRESELGLSPGVTLLSREAIPPYRLGIVFRDIRAAR